MIAVVYEAETYRNKLRELAEEDSIVLEIGPHTGKSTLNYADKTRLTVTVDIGRQSEEAFREICRKRGNIIHVKGDARNFNTVKKVMKHIKKCDLLAVDLGGGRYPDTVFKVWAVWSGVFKPKHSIIRNRGLGEFIKKAEVLDKSLETDYPDNGWLSRYGRAMPSKLKQQLEEFRFWIDIEEKERN